MRGAKQLQIVVMSAQMGRLRVRWIDCNGVTNGFSKKVENHQPWRFGFALFNLCRCRKRCVARQLWPLM
jgi:hypothetical protein